jgi:hypothetical protein
VFVSNHFYNFFRFESEQGLANQLSQKRFD